MQCSRSAFWLGMVAAMVGCGGGKSQAPSPAQLPEARPSGVVQAESGTGRPRTPGRVYWGDEHLHTGWSADAGAAGATLSPEDAVRFARGEKVKSSSGQMAKLERPLDWIAVTDHSDGMGVINEIRKGNPELLADPVVKRWSEDINKGGDAAKKATMEMISLQANKQLPKVITEPKFAKSVWEKNTAIMDESYRPGRFTTFIAYEWTSNAGGGDNLHRNVIYRDGKDKADQMLPMTTFESENPEDLWKWMSAWEKKTGGKLLAIPHNGNLSNGRMFELTTFEGKPITKEYAEERARWEPLCEAIQMKGQSESHPKLSNTDELAVGYEIWDRGNLALVPKKPGMLQYEYLREALKNGLLLAASTGANPFQYGMVGGTDAHNGLTAAEEDNFFGKFVSGEPRPERWNEDAMKFGARVVKGWEMTAAGYTGVWATENTREALWDAMKRRETYATSGPRILVRFFGGFDFTEADAKVSDIAYMGYRKGVPMGGELQQAPAGKAPTFLLGAVMDARGANLDRIQVVKGWIDAQGKTHEKVFDAVWGDAERRQPDKRGKLPPVGSTVDVASASFENTIGDPQLVTVWTDPEFDAGQRAFYYLRVLEIPTPRWTAYDAARYEVKMGKKVPMTTQERAFTSPIWYTP